MKWRKYRLSAKARSERASRAANARWRKHHAGDDPAPRQTRTIRITIEDTHRPRTLIVARRDEQDEHRWGRWHVRGATFRPVAASGLAKLIAAYLE